MIKCQNCDSASIVTATDVKCPKCNSSKIKNYDGRKAFASSLGVAVIIFGLGIFLSTGKDNLSGILGPLLILGSFIIVWDSLRKDFSRNLTVSKGVPWYQCSETDCSYHWYTGQNICKNCGNYI